LDGQWMTYTEAAVRLGVTPEAVREAHIATLKTDLERLTAELAGERAERQGEVELLKGQLVTERERADRAVADLTGERAARQADQEQLAAARAAADRATAELVELARRLAAIAETQTSAETAEAQPEPPRRWAIRAWRWMQKTA
jgi:chromosome segregation ATPase